MTGNKKIGATVEQIVKWYEDSIAYQTAIGLRSSVPECVRFYEGDQWATPTKATKHFPRPVVNVIEMICNNKKSQILSSPIKLVYKSESKEAAINKFNRFAEAELSRLRQREINNKAVLDGIIKGSYCYYYYWDKDVVGIDGLVEGDIAVQLYDPLDVHFADPKEKDEQKQEWIMFVSREDVEKIKREADKGIDGSKIADDESESIYNEVESETLKYVTVFTRFFRHNGEVYYERATRQIVFNVARPFTPNVERAKHTIDGIVDIENDEETTNEYLKSKPKATLYPVVFSSLKDRDKSIYGRSEVEKLIPNQKAINWNWGLQLLMSQDEAMGVTIIRPDALKGQQITNEPGQVITDHSREGNGIRRLEARQMSIGSASIADKLTDITRVITGSSEIMNGELISAGMSGAAIAQLQAQALKPIEDLQKSFWRSQEKIGEVLEQFLRFFFANKKFQYKDEKGDILNEEFNSEEFKDTRFDVTAEAIAGTVMSDVANINLLDSLFSKGAISLRMYIKNYPENAIANRQQLLDSIDEEEKGIVRQLQAQLSQMQSQMEQAVTALQAQEQAINNAKTIIGENEALKRELLSIQARNAQMTQGLVQQIQALNVEYTQKIDAANRVLAGIGARAKEYYSDAKQMASEVAQGRGITKPATNNIEEGNNPKPDISQGQRKVQN